MTNINVTSVNGIVLGPNGPSIVGREKRDYTLGADGIVEQARQLYADGSILIKTRQWVEAWKKFDEYKMLIDQGKNTGICPEEDDHLHFLFLCVIYSSLIFNP